MTIFNILILLLQITTLVLAFLAYRKTKSHELREKLDQMNRADAWKRVHGDLETLNGTLIEMRVLENDEVLIWGK